MAGELRRLEGYERHDLLRLLEGDELVGVELGVAEGELAARLYASGRFRALFGVDAYSDHHDVAQYKRALGRLGLCAPRYKLLRMTFDDALELFDDGSLDFVYVDGYAHLGEEGGATIARWYRKVRVGGLMAGDDYHPTWPRVVEAVDHLVGQVGAPLWVTDRVGAGDYDRFPSWAIRKPAAARVRERPEAVRAAARQRQAAERSFHLRELAKRVLPAPLAEAIGAVRRAVRRRDSSTPPRAER